MAPPAPLAHGRVLELHRWPVKSMGGEPVGHLRLDARGVAGDRTHALYDLHRGAPRRLTARQVPHILGWHASYPPDHEPVPEDPPLAVLTAPDGRTWTWDDPALPAALAHDLGREVTLRRDLAGQQDLERSVLVTTRASLDALGEELGHPLDLRRFRTNVHVVLDADPWADHGWGGRRLQIGNAVLDLLHACERCVIPTRHPDTFAKDPAILKHLTAARGGLFGINARPLGPGRIAVGDPVSVL